MSEMYQYLEKIENASGTNTKSDILFEACVKTPEIIEFFRLSFDDTVYGVGVRSFEKIVEYDGKTAYFDAGELVAPHCTGNYTDWAFTKGFLKAIESSSGNEQLRALKNILTSFSSIQAKWLARLLLKDLKMGISLITINKVLVSMSIPKIDKFEVQLADKFDTLDEKEIRDKVGLPCIVGLKYDGMRGILTKKGKIVTFTSRNGEIIDYVPELISYFEKREGDFTLDGEILCKNFSTLQRRIGRLSDNIEPAEGLHFRLFDILNLNGQSFFSEPQKYRFEFIRDFFLEDEFLKLEEAFITSNIDEIKSYFKSCCDRKEEGIMLKKMDSPYEPGTRKNWFKVKPIYENSFKVTGSKLGTGKYSGMISTLYVTDESGEINSGVGSGLTEDLMIEIANLNRAGKLIGTVVDIVYNEITVDKNNKKSLRFPRILRIRYDKKEADTLGTLTPGYKSRF